MAPASIAYVVGMSGGWDWVVLVYFVCCGLSRLARYNVTAEELSDESGKVSYFEGTPIPTSLVLVAGIAALLALFFAATGRRGRLVLQLTALAVILGALSILIGSV